MTDIADTTPPEQPSALHPELGALTDSGAHRFDPVRFRYIESMAANAAAQRPAVTRIIEQKALLALAAYRADLASARSEAELIVTRVAAKFPDSSAAIGPLFDCCDFKGVKRLAARLERGSNQGMLLALTREIGQGADASRVQGASFDDLLLQQELDIVKPANGPSGQFRELASTKSFRKSREKLSTDKLVTRAIKECPDDCGPLNPQMLAIRSLTVMRELSPQYLNRFVTYIDTLLWLEQVAKEP